MKFIGPTRGPPGSCRPHTKVWLFIIAKHDWFASTQLCPPPPPPPGVGAGPKASMIFFPKGAYMVLFINFGLNGGYVPIGDTIYGYYLLCTMSSDSIGKNNQYMYIPLTRAYFLSCLIRKKVKIYVLTLYKCWLYGNFNELYTSWIYTILLQIAKL